MAATGVEADRGFSRIVEVAELSGMTPNEMRQVRDLSGVPLGQLLDDEHLDSIDAKSQMTMWIAMRRAGTPITWEEAGDCLPERKEEPPVDPTNGRVSTPSPGSAGSGA